LIRITMYALRIRLDIHAVNILKTYYYHITDKATHTHIHDNHTPYLRLEMGALLRSRTAGPARDSDAAQSETGCWGETVWLESNGWVGEPSRKVHG
jgi:hypothetical protein